MSVVTRMRKWYICIKYSDEAPINLILNNEVGAMMKKNSNSAVVLPVTGSDCFSSVSQGGQNVTLENSEMHLATSVIEMTVYILWLAYQ